MTGWTCPCCGAVRPVPLAPEDLARQFRSVMMQHVIRALAQRPMTYAELAWSVYRGCEPAGGGERSLVATIHHFGPDLERFGWRIVRPGPGGAVGRLRLEPLGVGS